MCGNSFVGVDCPVQYARKWTRWQLNRITYKQNVALNSLMNYSAEMRCMELNQCLCTQSLRLANYNSMMIRQKMDEHRPWAYGLSSWFRSRNRSFFKLVVTVTSFVQYPCSVWHHICWRREFHVPQGLSADGEKLHMLRFDCQNIFGIFFINCLI